MILYFGKGQLKKCGSIRIKVLGETIIDTLICVEGNNMSERWGRCSCCGRPSFHEFCNKCDGKEPQEEETIWCAMCRDMVVFKKGDYCQGCIAEHAANHDPPECMDNCIICESLITRGDCE